MVVPTTSTHIQQQTRTLLPLLHPLLLLPLPLLPLLPHLRGSERAAHLVVSERAAHLPPSPTIMPQG